MIKTIFAIDDDNTFLESISKILKQEGYNVITESNPTKVMERTNQVSFDLLLIDVKMPGLNGIELMKLLSEKFPLVPIIFISGQSSITIAVEAIKFGAYDFIEKPVEPDRLLITIQNALEKKTLLEEKNVLEDRIDSINKIIGNCEKTQILRNEILQVAPTNAKILITGESGTGKELIAWSIFKHSERKNKPFVKLNCAAIPKELLESELFGHKKGAFTGATSDRIGKFSAANGGTIFLDEIGDMTLNLQAKLLRVLEENEIEIIGESKTQKVDVRVIAATNRNLNEQIKEGLFREDLFHRLNVVNIHIPPIRERRKDIIPLVFHFLEKFNNEYNKSIVNITEQASAILKKYSWYGNVREIRNFVERLVIYTNKDIITLEDVLAQIESFSQQNSQLKMHVDNFHNAKENFEIEYLKSALELNDWKVTKTAEMLGMDRTGLFKKMQKYGLRK